MKIDFKNKIHKIIRLKLKKKISDNFNLIKSKELDSIDIIEIISKIEDEFKIKFSNKELVKIKNLNLKGLRNLILKKIWKIHYTIF